MRTSWIALCALVLLTGCPGPAQDEIRPPVAAQCEDRCFEPCLKEGEDTGIRWDGSPVEAEAWDRLVDGGLFPLADKLRQCEVNRRACTQCLDRLKKAGVIQ